MPMTVDERSRLCREAIMALEAGAPSDAPVNDTIERLLTDDPDATATADYAGDFAAALG